MNNEDILTLNEIKRFEGIMKEEEVAYPWYWYRDSGEVLCLEDNGDLCIVRQAGTPLKQTGLADVVHLNAQNSRL
jgi:hypothetical protein